MTFISARTLLGVLRLSTALVGEVDIVPDTYVTFAHRLGCALPPMSSVTMWTRRCG
jgi:hypothetical protein